MPTKWITVNRIIRIRLKDLEPFKCVEKIDQTCLTMLSIKCIYKSDIWYICT